MPLLDKPLHELREYRGISPLPAGFDDYWDAGLAELASIDPHVWIERTDAIHPRNAEAFDLWFTSIGGARSYAKYLRPKDPAGRLSAVLQFHGYSGNSGNWGDKLGFTGQGLAVAAMDCRGQGGRSEDVSRVSGNTLNGHFIRGLREGPGKLLFRSIFLDTVQLARVVMSLPEIDGSRIGCSGGSQGGALAIACAALEPRIQRCVSAYPFLSDFRRVWEMDLAKDAYSELRTYFRNFDPLHEQEDEIFETLGFIDVKNLAPRIRASVLMAISQMDPICPPSTQFAVFNNLSCEKESVLYPDFGHEHLPGFDDRAFDFLLGL